MKRPRELGNHHDRRTVQRKAGGNPLDPSITAKMGAQKVPNSRYLPSLSLIRTAQITMQPEGPFASRPCLTTVGPTL